MLVFVRPATGIGASAIGRPELLEWNIGDLGPEMHCRIQVESFMEIKPDPQAVFIENKEPAHPHTEQSHHPGVGVGEADRMPGPGGRSNKHSLGQPSRRVDQWPVLLPPPA